MRGGAIVVPVRLVAIGGAALALAIGLVIAALQPAGRDAVQRVIDPRTTAGPPAIDLQRTAAEHALQRGYVKAMGQLADVRKLTLAIPPSQAAAITEKAVADLKAIRHDALVAVGSRSGLAPPALDTYVGNAEAQLAESTFADDKPVLLAPDLYAVVARADDLFQRSADAATRDLSRSPTASPAPSPSGTATPGPSPAATPRASPSR